MPGKKWRNIMTALTASDILVGKRRATGDGL
jgi:hypothetical protein